MREASTRNAAARTWAGHDLRRRWRSLVALGLLAGVTAGFAMAALAGARRTGTALARLRAQTNAADAIAFPSQAGLASPNFSALAARPEVKQLAVWDLLFGDINGQAGGLIFGSDDGTFLGSVDRPVVVRGRMYDPAAPDEIVVDENAAAMAPLGSVLTFRAQSPDQRSAPNGAPATGPTFHLRVVGVVREIDEFLFVPDGQGFVSPAMIEQNRSQILTLSNAEIILAPGKGGMGALQRDVNALLLPGTPLFDLQAAARRVTTTLAVERVALLLLAAAVAFAGGFLVAQALVRSAATVAEDVPALRAIGMTRPEVGVAGALPHVLTALVSGAAGFATAGIASVAFPVGLGRQIDPRPGYHIDWTVLGPGTALAILLVIGAALMVARRSYLAGRHAPTEPSPLAAWIRRWAPVSVGLGAGMAFERARGARGVPARPALIGATLGILGIVATLSINQGIHYALANPQLAGVTWDAGVTPDASDLTPRGVNPSLTAAVQAAAGPRAAVALQDRFVLPVGGIGVPTFAFRAPDGGPVSLIGLTVTAGRAPERRGEAAIGPATAKDLGVRTGETITIGQGAVPVRIVGVALFPSDVHAEFDQGLWLTPGQYDAVVPAAGSDFTGGNVNRLLVVRFPAGTNAAVMIGRMQQPLESLPTPPSDLSPPTLPLELVNLHNVRVLPTMLAGFLALVAIGAVSLVLVSSARRRRRDFAILRALGLSRAGTRLVINAQSTAIGLAGLVVGVPLGIVAGRTGWRLVAEQVPLAVVAPLVLLAALALVPSVVVTVNALALWPGRTVARRAMPTEALHAE